MLAFVNTLRRLITSVSRVSKSQHRPAVQVELENEIKIFEARVNVVLAKYADSAVTSTNTNAEADVAPIVASEPASDVTGSAVEINSENAEAAGASGTAATTQEEEVVEGQEDGDVTLVEQVEEDELETTPFDQRIKYISAAYLSPALNIIGHRRLRDTQSCPPDTSAGGTDTDNASADTAVTRKRAKTTGQFDLPASLLAVGREVVKKRTRDEASVDTVVDERDENPKRSRASSEAGEDKEMGQEDGTGGDKLEHQGEEAVGTATVGTVQEGHGEQVENASTDGGATLPTEAGVQEKKVDTIPNETVATSPTDADVKAPKNDIATNGAVAKSSTDADVKEANVHTASNEAVATPPTEADKQEPIVDIASEETTATLSDDAADKEQGGNVSPGTSTLPSTSSGAVDSSNRDVASSSSKEVEVHDDAPISTTTDVGAQSAAAESSTLGLATTPFYEDVATNIANGPTGSINESQVNLAEQPQGGVPAASDAANAAVASEASQPVVPDPATTLPTPSATMHIPTHVLEAVAYSTALKGLDESPAAYMGRMYVQNGHARRLADIYRQDRDQAFASRDIWEHQCSRYIELDNQNMIRYSRLQADMFQDQRVWREQKEQLERERDELRARCEELESQLSRAVGKGKGRGREYETDEDEGNDPEDGSGSSKDDGKADEQESDGGHGVDGEADSSEQDGTQDYAGPAGDADGGDEDAEGEDDFEEIPIAGGAATDSIGTSNIVANSASLPVSTILVSDADNMSGVVLTCTPPSPRPTLPTGLENSTRGTVASASPLYTGNTPQAWFDYAPRSGIYSGHKHLPEPAGLTLGGEGVVASDEKYGGPTRITRTPYPPALTTWEWDASFSNNLDPALDGISGDEFDNIMASLDSQTTDPAATMPGIHSTSAAMTEAQQYNAVAGNNAAASGSGIVQPDMLNNGGAPECDFGQWLQTPGENGTGQIMGLDAMGMYEEIDLTGWHADQVRDLHDMFGMASSGAETAKQDEGGDAPKQTPQPLDNPSTEYAPEDAATPPPTMTGTTTASLGDAEAGEMDASDPGAPIEPPITFESTSTPSSTAGVAHPNATIPTPLADLSAIGGTPQAPAAPVTGSITQEESAAAALVGPNAPFPFALPQAEASAREDKEPEIAVASAPRPSMAFGSVPTTSPFLTAPVTQAAAATTTITPVKPSFSGFSMGAASGFGKVGMPSSSAFGAAGTPAATSSFSAFSGARPSPLAVKSSFSPSTSLASMTAPVVPQSTSSGGFGTWSTSTSRLASIPPAAPSDHSGTEPSGSVFGEGGKFSGGRVFADVTKESLLKAYQNGDYKAYIPHTNWQAWESLSKSPVMNMPDIPTGNADLCREYNKLHKCHGPALVQQYRMLYQQYRPDSPLRDTLEMTESDSIKLEKEALEEMMRVLKAVMRYNQKQNQESGRSYNHSDLLGDDE